MSFVSECPFEVDAPVMLQRWERLTFLHWPFDSDEIQRLLPAGLTVESHDGWAWVGLVPFFMRVSTARGRGAPWVSNFCETNVRTYVRDEGGRSGVWFFSLDAARLGAVAVGRTVFGLPYFWTRMSLTETGDEIDYRCRRRWPGPRGVSSSARIRVGPVIDPTALTDLDHFLTARWVLFSSAGRRRSFARAWHEPWPLRRAELIGLDDQLMAAAGLPAPTASPLVHYSEGVDVRLGPSEGYP